MNTFLTIVGALFIIQFVLKDFFKGSVSQAGISLYGFNKIPKVLLDLASINRSQDTSYGDLNKEEQKKFDKVYEKIHDAIWCKLTYLDSHDLIHIQKTKDSYLHQISDNSRHLVYEEIDEESSLCYILYRKDNGWFRGAELIGYLMEETHSPENPKPIILFRFPEKLIRWRFFTKSLQDRYHLEEHTIGDYIDKDELGYSGGYSMVSYETKSKENAIFNFSVY